MPNAGPVKRLIREQRKSISSKPHRIIMMLNWSLLMLALVPSWWHKPDYRALVVLLLMCLPLIPAITVLRRHHWREMQVHFGMTAALLFGFYSAWLPPIVVLLFVGTGMLNLLFLFRPLGGVYFALMSMVVTVPIGLAMMGFHADVPYLWWEQFAIVSVGGLSVGLNGFAVAQQQRSMAIDLRQSQSLIERMQEVHRQFTQAIAGAPDVKETLWQVTELCIPLLDLEDCVIYLLNHSTGQLEQAAAYGPKSQNRGEILSPIRIALGKGIVGKAAMEKRPVRDNFLARNPNYIVDDKARQSELAVPILLEGKVFGVIDSEHSRRGFFTDQHVALFQLMASLCANKIAELQLLNSKMEQASAERALTQVQQLEDLRHTFLNNLSHDLRTPLSLIQGPLQELNKRSEPEVTKLAQVALRNAKRLNEMVSGLLDMHKLERGAMTLQVKAVDLSARAREWSGLFLHEAEKRSLNYQVEIRELPLVECDEGKIGQVIQNLLSNAFKFTPDQGIIRLQLGIDTQFIQLEVEDSGPGIPKDFRERVFERFFKIHSQSHIEGTGLGLAMVKAFVELMGGNLHLDQSPLGGARFRIFLPFKPHQETIEPLDFGPDFEEELKPSIVLVEDHPDMREFITGLLQDQYQVQATATAEEGWELIEQNQPDLVISDLMLPGMGGDMLTKRIKNAPATDHIPVLALTAKHSLQSKLDLYALGADNYLTKPFDSKELKGIVAGLILQRKKLHAKFEGGLATGEAKPKNLRTIDELIRQHLNAPDFGPRSLEKMMGLNRNQLQRKIKQLTGKTPVEYIRTYRLSHARRLLQRGGLNVSEAAFASGFNQVSYFSRVYKAEFGRLPSEDLN